MELENIAEILETTSQETVNARLKSGWRLLEYRIEKLVEPVSHVVEFKHLEPTRYEELEARRQGMPVKKWEEQKNLAYRERFSVLYIVGRSK